MTKEHYSAYYSYEYNSIGIIKSIIRSNKIIDISGNINQTQLFNIMGYVYDEADGTAYVVDLDGDGKVIIENSKAKKDTSKLDMKVVLNKTSTLGEENKILLK